MADANKDAEELMQGASYGAQQLPTLSETFLKGASAGAPRLAPAPGEDHANFPDDGSTRH